MKEMTINDALKLVNSKAAPAISIYLGTNIQDRDGVTRMKKNLQSLYRTAETLIAKTYDSRTRDRLLVPLKKALAALRLTRSKGGLAIYHSEHFSGVVRLPTTVSNLAVAAESFHLKPIFRCVQIRRRYRILAFRKKFVELISVTADETKLIQRVELLVREERPFPENEAPKRGFNEGLKLRRQKDLREAMMTLNRQLESYWQGESLPLLLAGPLHQQDAFRTACSHTNLMERGLIGHVDELDLNALEGLSTSLMEQYFSKFEAQAIVAFHKAKGSGFASTDLRQIAEAAARGQVQSLLIAEDRQIWGHFDRENGLVKILEQRNDATSDDLLDDIAELTMIKGGKITVLPSTQMPGNYPIVAVLRWIDIPKDLQYPHQYRPANKMPWREQGAQIIA
ncbi:MAG: hypothetical protein H7318_19470 [Oligoflexus sp.]|nr:hypothetical protein [Oligoflexus sp.]